jgi:hypothetical protein
MTQPVETPPAPETPPAEDAKFTQADVDRIVGEAKRKAKPADYDDLKSAAKRLADIEAANATDLEKAVAAAKRETEETIRGEVRRERVLDRIEVLAAKDFADPEDARLRLGSRADDFVNKDGQVDAEEIAKALKTLLDDKPHLKAVQPDGRPHGQADLGPRTPAPPADPRAADLAQIEADLRLTPRR